MPQQGVRHLVLAWLLVLGCGSHPPPPPTDMPTLSDPPTGGSGSGRGSATGSGSGSATAAANPRSTGLTPQLINAVGSKILVVDELTSLRLNSVERLAAQTRIAEWASKEGLSILPPDKVEGAIGLASAGLDPLSGKACGPPLDRDNAMQRWIMGLGAAGEITPRVDCHPDCALQLEIKLYGLGTEFFSAPFDPGQPWEAELVKRLGEMRDNGGHERYGHGNNPVSIGGVPRKDGAADWYLEGNAFANRTADAEGKACGMGDREVAVLLQRDAAGTVKCEHARPPGYITEYSAKVNACMCQVALKQEHPTADRTFVTYASPIKRVDRKTKNGKDISAMLIGGNEYRPEGTAMWFLRDDDSIADCFAGRTEDVEAKEAVATLDFDGNGAVKKATIGDPTGLLKPDERACVTKKLMTILTPCPATPPQYGSVRITLHIHKPYGEK